MIAIMGPSGSGKSTLFVCDIRYGSCDERTGRFDGKDITELREKRGLPNCVLMRWDLSSSKMYMMKNLTILDNIILPAAESKKTKESNKEKQMRGEALYAKTRHHRGG